MSNAGMSQGMSFFFEMSVTMASLDMVLVSRAPRPIMVWGNILSPFRRETWILVVATLLLFSILLSAFHRIYRGLALPVRPEPSSANFFLFTFCKATEPEPLPWFLRRGHGGQALVFYWTLMALALVLFYQSNLRAELMTVKYERPIDTLDDAVSNGKRVWIPKGAVTLRYNIGVIFV